MARLMGVNLPDNKKVVYGLTHIYGIGIKTAQKIITDTGINPKLTIKNLSTTDLEKIREMMEKYYKVEGDLRMILHQNIKRLKEINSYRGIRHIKKLPVRGQRTKTNARTKRGKKVTVGSGRKSAAQKT